MILQCDPELSFSMVLPVSASNFTPYTFLSLLGLPWLDYLLRLSHSEKEESLMGALRRKVGSTPITRKGSLIFS
jgi:hypothetical protein